MMKTKFSALVSAHVSKTFLALLFLSLALVNFGGINTAVAEETQSAEVSEALKDAIAVLDMQQLLNDSKAAASIRKQIESRRDSYKKEIEKDEDKLRGAEKELMKQREILSEEAFAEKGREFQSDILNAQKDINEKKYKLDKSYAEAMSKLREEIVKITAKIAAKEKYALVLSRQQVVIVDKNTDITAEVMKELNDKVKKIAVK